MNQYIMDIMDQTSRSEWSKLIGNTLNSGRLKDEILTTLQEQPAPFILVVGPRRVGKDHLLKDVLKDSKQNRLRFSGAFISSQEDLKLISEDLQPKMPVPIINMEEVNYYGFDATDERSSATSRIRAQAYNNIIDFSTKNNAPIVANLSIPSHIANPWDTRGIEERWKSFLTDVLQLSLPDKAIIYYLNMDVQLCALKLWDFRDNPETFKWYGERMMCIPDLEPGLWLEKSEAEFFEDLEKILQFPLKSKTQIMMEGAATERGEMSS